jgi:hypothetical protein
MANETKAIIMQLRPKFQELRDARIYTEPQVKAILRGFAHDIARINGYTWSEDWINALVEETFNFG